MQGTRIPSLVWEDSTSRHNYGACALEPRNSNYWTHVAQLLKPSCPRGHPLQQKKPLQWEVHALQGGAGPAHGSWGKAWAAMCWALPAQPKINKMIKKTKPLGPMHFKKRKRKNWVVVHLTQIILSMFLAFIITWSISLYINLCVFLLNSQQIWQCHGSESDLLISFTPSTETQMLISSRNIPVDTPRNSILSAIGHPIGQAYLHMKLTITDMHNHAPLLSTSLTLFLKDFLAECESPAQCSFWFCLTLWRIFEWASSLPCASISSSVWQGGWALLHREVVRVPLASEDWSRVVGKLLRFHVHPLLVPLTSGHGVSPEEWESLTGPGHWTAWRTPIAGPGCSHQHLLPLGQ